MFFLYRFGNDRRGLPWSSVPFSLHLVPASERALPPALDSPEARYLLQVVPRPIGPGLARRPMTRNSRGPTSASTHADPVLSWSNVRGVQGGTARNEDDALGRQDALQERRLPSCAEGTEAGRRTRSGRVRVGSGWAERPARIRGHTLSRRSGQSVAAARRRARCGWWPSTGAGHHRRPVHRARPRRRARLPPHAG